MNPTRLGRAKKEHMNTEETNVEVKRTYWPLEKIAFVLAVQPSVLIALTEDPNENIRLGVTVSDDRMYFDTEEMGRWLAHRAE